jgi:nucleoside-diphosphate-sugar epimerase
MASSTGASALARALVTGGAGFIGFHLASHLAGRGYEVTICDDFSRGRRDDDLEALCARPNVSLFECDLTRPDALATLDGEFDYTYHLAAVNGTRHFYEMPDVVLRVNVLALVNVLDAWAAGRFGRLLFASSSETYAGTARAGLLPIPTPEDVPLLFDDLHNPRLSYAASKLLGEVMVINYARTLRLPATIVRYHNVYGPRMGDEHVIPQFAARILAREDPFAIHGADDSRAFCFVDDAVRATRLVMECEAAAGLTVHVGDPTRELPIRDLAALMFDLFDFHPALDVRPAPGGSVGRRCPDISRLTELTGFRPETSLEDGLRRTFTWYARRQPSAAAPARAAS